MARIAGVNIPREKRVEIGLTYVYGIGRTTANEILAKVGLSHVELSGPVDRSRVPGAWSACPGAAPGDARFPVLKTLEGFQWHKLIGSQISGLDRPGRHRLHFGEAGFQIAGTRNLSARIIARPACDRQLPIAIDNPVL